MSGELLLGKPHPALRGAVIRYEGFAERAHKPVVTREFACSYVPIIIDLDAGWTIADHRHPHGAVHLGSFVAGLTDGPVLVEHQGTACCVQVDLAPLAARRILGLPLSELTNRTVALDDVLGSSARELVERVGNAARWEDRFAIVDEVLTTRLAESAPVNPGVAWSIDQLAGGGGLAPIGLLADELGWSHRRLIARFRDAVGMPPKRMARILRFERLIDLIRGEPDVDWALAAVTCRFADQAHLAREVRVFSGLTPTALRAERVNFVQDGAGVAA